MERIDDDAGLLTRSVWHLAGWATVEDFAGRASEARELLGCEWLRFCAGDTDDELVVMFGQIARDATLLGCDTASAWSGWIRDVGVVGSGDSAPGLVSMTEPAAGLWELRFRYPPEIDTKQIVAALDRLKPLSGCGYIEMVDTPSDQGHFTLLAGNRDPLAEVFAFSDYAQQILQDPQQGQPRIDLDGRDSPRRDTAAGLLGQRGAAPADRRFKRLRQVHSHPQHGLSDVAQQPSRRCAPLVGQNPKTSCIPISTSLMWRGSLTIRPPRNRRAPRSLR